MREHQIVITLKPDQFLEIQRLARAANAKSMGIFVRQQLLAALGIEAGASAGGAMRTGRGPELNEALQQMRRLHSELKTFVAESLSLYDVSNQGDPQANLPVSAFAQPTDALENVAERTFAISPRLGPIGADLQSAPDRWASLTTFSRIERNEAHRREAHRFHHPHAAASEILDVPYSADDAGGSRTISDPLEKLLPTANEFKPLSTSQREQESAPGQGDADVFGDQPLPQEAQIPRSLAERNRQLHRGPGVSQQSADSHAAVEARSGGFGSASDLDDATYDSHQPATDVPSPEPESAAKDPPLVPNSQPNINPNTGRTIGQPSLSGSPPPKRRQV